MAEEVAIAGTESRAKLRNPLGVVGLSIITIGIYYIFWWYYINREMRDFGRARGTDLGQNPTNSVLAITLGCAHHRPRDRDAVDHVRQDPADPGDRRRRPSCDRPHHLHPAAPDRAGGCLVRAERAQQGLDRAGERRGREPAGERRRPHSPPRRRPHLWSSGRRRRARARRRRASRPPRARRPRAVRSARLRSP